MALALLSLPMTGALNGCVSDGSEVRISVVDHRDTLTSKAGDMLFVIKLIAAPKSYAKTRLDVDIIDSGHEKLLVPCVLEDMDDNLMLDPGETLHCHEETGFVDTYDRSEIGQTFKVELRELFVLVATSEWTPGN